MTLVGRRCRIRELLSTSQRNRPAAPLYGWPTEWGELCGRLDQVEISDYKWEETERDAGLRTSSTAGRMGLPEAPETTL